MTNDESAATDRANASKATARAPTKAKSVRASMPFVTPSAPNPALIA